jgi:hypothetical protein
VYDSLVLHGLRQILLFCGVCFSVAFFGSCSYVCNQDVSQIFRSLSV